MSNALFIDGGVYEECPYETDEWLNERKQILLESIQSTLNHPIFVKQEAERPKGRCEIIFSYHILTNDELNPEILNSLRKKISAHILCCESQEDVLVKRQDVFDREVLRPPNYPFLILSLSKPKPIKLKYWFLHEPSPRRCSI